MQVDQSVISLRPGGGAGTQGSRFAFGLISTSSSSCDSLPLRSHGGFKTGDLRFECCDGVHYTRDQLLHIREAADVTEDILKIKQEIEAEFVGGDESWSRGDSISQSQSRYSEPDNCDWRGWSAQAPASGEERSWETLQDGKQVPGRFEGSPQEANLRQDQLNSQFATAQISSNQGVRPPPALIKAEIPWSPQRGNLSENERVLKTVKGILNKLTAEKFDVLKGQLIDSGITTPDILKAVLEPTFCPMYGLLCADHNKKLPPFPSDEPCGKEITFKRILLNNCQEAFEGFDNLRAEIRQMTAPEQEWNVGIKKEWLNSELSGTSALLGSF